MIFLTLLSFAASLLGGFVFPWWGPGIVGLILGFWKFNGGIRTLFATASGAALSWGVMAAHIQMGNHGLLAGKVAGLFHLPNGWWLVGITALVGSLTAGLGASAGGSLRTTPRRQRRY